MQWLIFTDAKINAVEALNDDERALVPREIDNPASAYFGKGALPASILNAPGYERFKGTIQNITKFDGEAADLFLPPQDEP